MNLSALSLQFPAGRVATASGATGFRRAGTGPTLVLLHGIGSASGSWLRQLAQLQGAHTVLAWDAPGYGQSEPLPMAEPGAPDYGRRVWQWLDALALPDAAVTLVGHSLGALMAAAAAGQQPGRVKRLVLLSPALGYGLADAALREGKLRDRLATLQTLGPRGMAEKRGTAMLSPAAAPELVDYVRGLMAQIDPAGYTQAARMLAGADLATLLRAVRCPVLVASGAADTITPAPACEGLARAAGVPYVSLGSVGHACALEAADAVNHLLEREEDS
jgi:pimeloyl-ACP methyl ester carboxylesterase